MSVDLIAAVTRALQELRDTTRPAHVRMSNADMILAHALEHASIRIRQGDSDE